MKSIKRRLTAVERRLAPSNAEPQVILVRGGFQGGDPTHATAGNLRWECAPAESFAEFKARAATAAMAAGERFVVVGGLQPDDERSSVMPICADRT